MLLRIFVARFRVQTKDRGNRRNLSPTRKYQINMGLFDSVIGAVAGKLGGQNPLHGAVSDLITQNGGLQGLMDKFSQGGLGEIFSSWVGTQANQAISPEQIQNVIGSEQMNALAGKLGIDSATASSFLAEHLPKIIDKLTPGGQVDPNADHRQALANLLPSLLQSIEGSKAQP